MNEYMGAIKLFAGSNAPQGWMFCQGQLLQINAYQTFFTVIGNTYGGDGSTTFALPDLRGNVPVGAGQNGGNNYSVGQRGGNAWITLSAQQMPEHTHTVNVAVSSANATDSVAKGGQNLGAPGNGQGGNFNATFGYVQGAANVQLATDSVTVDVAGGNSPISLMKPFLGMNYIICVNGLYPQPNS